LREYLSEFVRISKEIDRSGNAGCICTIRNHDFAARRVRQDRPLQGEVVDRGVVVNAQNIELKVE